MKVEDWACVPREATRTMCARAVTFANGDAVYKNVAAAALEIEERIYGEAYEAMLSAAPTPSPVPVDADELAGLLESVRGALTDAYNNAFAECCGRGVRGECCGSPVPAWSACDQKIMDVLSPIENKLAALAANGEKS